MSVHDTIGRKDDAKKLRYDLVDPFALAAMVAVLTHGADKYGDENWRLVDDAERRYVSAALRHIEAWRGGEENDPEWDLHHLAHAMCNLHFLLAKAFADAQAMYEAMGNENGNGNENENERDGIGYNANGYASHDDPPTQPSKR